MMMNRVPLTYKKGSEDVQIELKWDIKPKNAMKPELIKHGEDTVALWFAHSTRD